MSGIVPNHLVTYSDEDHVDHDVFKCVKLSRFKVELHVFNNGKETS